MGWSHRCCDVATPEVRHMIYDKLLKLKDELGKKALRDPRTADELLVKKNYGRVMTILTRRYEYGMESHLDDLRRQDHLDEIISINQRRT